MTTALKPRTLEYARLLQQAGFTVYTYNSAHNMGSAGWFHYSRVVDGITCYGTAHIEPQHGLGSFYETAHAMPVRPTREHGSSIIVGSRSNRRDKPINPLSVEAAEYTAMPQNTAEYIPGVSFHNFKPWGVGSGVYEPLDVSA